MVRTCVHDIVEGLSPHTREDGRGTPFLIRNIERRVRVRTNVDVDQERPLGLYGNMFARSRFYIL